MTEPTTGPATTTAADTNTGGPNTDGEATRLERVESKVDRLADAVSRLLPASHAESQQRVESKLDRESSVADQVRAELDRRDHEQQTAAEETSLADRVKALEEKPPGAPVRRATKLLGWGDGRK